MARKYDLDTAAAEAQARYGPEKRALSALLQDAKDELEAGISQANYSSEATRRAARAARPLMKAAYGEAESKAAGARSRLDRDLSTLSAAADPFKAASAREAAGAAGRLAKATADALGDLTSREVGASAGRDFAVSSLRGQYGKSKGKILDRLLGVEQDAGAYVAGRAGVLQKERAGRKVTIRGQDVSAEQRAADRASRERIAAAKRKDAKEKKAKGPKLNLNQQNAAIDQIGAAQGAFKAHPQARGVLRDGLKIGGLTDAAGNKLKLPTVKSDIYISAGFQLAQHGSIDSKTARALRARGVKVPKEWLRKPATPETVQQVGEFIKGR